MPTCQRLLLSHVPDGDSFPRAAGQDAVCCGVELQYVHRTPAGPQGQPCTTRHVLAALGQAPHLHLQPQGEVGQSPARRARPGWVPAVLDLGLLLFQALVSEGPLIAARWDQSCRHPRCDRADTICPVPHNLGTSHTTPQGLHPPP